ncbi:MAG: DUF1028 domain-containing protein [Bacillota bacterium]
MRPSTFSIVGYDPVRREWGVAVASKFLAAGAVVMHAQAGAGAVATQAHANVSYGPRGLELMGGGVPAQETVRQLTGADEERHLRQLGVVDACGRSATFTGEGCIPWAGGIAGEGFACQGNILAGEQVVRAMADAFVTASGPLARRLHAALLAGDRAGGDRRGRQSAGILVVRAGGGYGGLSDRYMDLRVDDHPDPVVELGRLIDLHDLYFLPPAPGDILPLDEALITEIQHALARLRYWDGPVDGRWTPELEAALSTYEGVQNLEERHRRGPEIDRKVLAYLRTHAQQARGRQGVAPAGTDAGGRGGQVAGLPGGLEGEGH